jgi:hypothetical protein
MDYHVRTSPPVIPPGNVIQKTCANLKCRAAFETTARNKVLCDACRDLKRRQTLARGR